MYTEVYLDKRYRNKVSEKIRFEQKQKCQHKFHSWIREPMPVFLTKLTLIVTIDSVLINNSNFGEIIYKTFLGGKK